MKKTFVCLVCLLFLTGSKEPATVVVMHGDQDVSLVDGDDRFLTISGLSRREETGWIATHFRASDDANTVQIHMKTSDGQRWRAVWTREK